MNGSLSQSTGGRSAVTTGTLAFTGCNVKKIIFNNITVSPSISGTYSIQFTDNSNWTYNYATGQFTSN